jgi:spore coat polysaccharide biosynthesis protein SpsF (cytidylyltransferase family)
MWQINSLKKLGIPIIIATTTNNGDVGIENLAREMNVLCVKGPEDDVYKRFKLVKDMYPARNLIRITSDCPLVSPKIIDQLLNIHMRLKVDYSSNFLLRSFPDGLDVEVFSQEAFEKLESMKLSSYQREHVTPAFYQNKNSFISVNLLEERNLGNFRWTIDFPSDFLWLKSMLSSMGVTQAPEYEEILQFINDNPEYYRTEQDVNFV